MSHSNSSLNCFTNCMAKYNFNYILHTTPCKPKSDDLEFGVMAHDVLHKAGELRDKSETNIIDKDEYETVIPSEVTFGSLKMTFGISNWSRYFMPVISKTAEYEKSLSNDLYNTSKNSITIYREKKLQLTVEELKRMGYKFMREPLVGVIDLLLLADNYATIVDYKFSNKRKTQDNFDIDSQLQIYALLVHVNYGIPLKNIRYGYIDIPKEEFGKPTLLSNGTLSRSKSQNVSQELYEKAVISIHGDDPYYNCKPGGHYYDCWCNLALNKAAYLSMQYLDLDTYNGIIKDVLDSAELIDIMIEKKLTFAKKYDSYSCIKCEYIDSCKPWLGVE